MEKGDDIRWRTWHKEERFGGGGDIHGVEILVKSDGLSHQRMAADPDDPIKSRAYWNAVYHAKEQLLRDLDRESYRLDPKTDERRALIRERITGCFLDIGLSPIFLEEIPNDYWGKDPYAYCSPWFIVTTRLGHFRVGWRKRVIELDWSRTLIAEKVTGEDLTKDEVTKDKTLIHAYGYEKLTEYLRVIVGRA